MSVPTVLGCLPLLQAGVFPAVHLLEGKKGGYRGRVHVLASGPKSNPFPFLPPLPTACWAEGGGWGKCQGPKIITR